MLYFSSTPIWRFHPFGVISTQTNEILEYRDQCSAVFTNCIFLLVICLCLRKSRIANFALNLNVNQLGDLSDLFDSELLILEPWELQF